MRHHRDHWFSRVELDVAPSWPTGDFWLNRWEEVENGDIPIDQSGMRRLSVWYELPYFEHLKKPHLLDLMHIEANVAKTILQTIWGHDGKDGFEVRSVCEAYNVHRSAWIIPGTDILQKAQWILSAEEKRKFCERIREVSFPTAYGSGFVRSFENEDPRGLKSHDYRCLLHHGFPIAIRGLLTPTVRNAIYAISKIFR
jgi:hypothetical protein